MGLCGKERVHLKPNLPSSTLLASLVLSLYLSQPPQHPGLKCPRPVCSIIELKPNIREPIIKTFSGKRQARKSYGSCTTGQDGRCNAFTRARVSRIIPTIMKYVLTWLRRYLLVSQDNHEIFLTIASYEPEYVECFEANFSNARAVIVDQATTYCKPEANS